jgi:hypothetical protein
MLSLDSFAQPNLAVVWAESGTTPKPPVSERPRLTPRRRLPYRPMSGESAITCCDAEANSCHSSNTLLSLTRCRLHLKWIQAARWSAEAPISAARANGLGVPENQGAFEFPEALPEALTPTGRGVPIS